MKQAKTLGTVVVLMMALGVAFASGQDKAEPQTPAAAPAQAVGKAEAKPAAGAATEYVIGESDLLAINVWHEPELTRTLSVRTDGKITMPLVGELQASGRTVEQLRAMIATELKRFLEAPEVTVIVQEPRSKFFTIIGKVVKPGSFPLGQRLTVIEGLALSGGFKEFAKVNKIYVIRTHPDGRSERLEFDYKRAVNGDLKQNFVLETHDTIVVP